LKKAIHYLEHLIKLEEVKEAIASQIPVNRNEENATPSLWID
jgi:hypothetical protein